MKFLKRIKLPNINAVLYKDMQQRTKRSGLMIEVFLVNMLLTLIALILLVSMGASAAMYSPINYDIFPTFFVVLSFLEFGFVVIVTPSVSAGCITMEREKQTFDVLLSTALTTRQIVWGKFWSAILQVLLLIFSAFPTYALVLMYGGVSFIQAFGVLATLLLITIYAAALGIFWSSVSKKSMVSSVMTYVFLLILIFGTISFVATVKGIAAVINEAMLETTGHTSFFKGDIFFFVLYLNPLCTIFDSISHLTGTSIFTSLPGMAGIGKNVTDFESSNILLMLWTPISLTVQMLVSWWLLESASKAIDPLRKKADKHARKRQRQQKTA
jgi:ABC-type transport system involved in multi-copper enzyme maturation permease subunit